MKSFCADRIRTLLRLQTKLTTSYLAFYACTSDKEKPEAPGESRTLLRTWDIGLRASNGLRICLIFRRDTVSLTATYVRYLSAMTRNLIRSYLTILKWTALARSPTLIQPARLSSAGPAQNSPSSPNWVRNPPTNAFQYHQ